MNFAGFFARWRVRLGYPLAAVVLWFARPTPASILAGAIVGTIGLWVRARAAGHLHKQEILTTTGPYAYTRNPLYLGSFVLTSGAAIAAHSWISALILFVYFAVFYSFVMRREEGELYRRHGDAFRDYAQTVPLFLPRLTPAKLSAASAYAGTFSFVQYKKNREYRAAIGFLLLLVVFVIIWRLRAL